MTDIAAMEGVPLLEWRFWPDFYWDERVGYYTVEGPGGARLRARRIAPWPSSFWHW